MRSTIGMRGAALAALFLASSHPAAGARLRTYLTANGGADMLTTNPRGDVVRERFAGLVEIGIGHDLGDRMLLEATYAWLGDYQQAPPIQPLPTNAPYPPDAERAFRVAVNPFLVRLRYARSGMRSGYFKPELSFGLGFYHVRCLLRNYPDLLPEETNQLLPAAELGIAALFVFDRNFMGYAGTRFAVMRRRSIADDTRHFDGLGLLLGLRVFLASPRDEIEGSDPSAWVPPRRR